MITFTTFNDNTCWRDCVGCILNIQPKKIPNFAKRFGNDFIQKTHEWLYKKFHKGMVYVPHNCFMEPLLPKEEIRYNQSNGPKGFSIGHISLIDRIEQHAVICKDGKVYWDNGEVDSERYDKLLGYFIIYDLGNYNKL